MNALEDEKL